MHAQVYMYSKSTAARFLQTEKTVKANILLVGLSLNV